MHVDTEGRLMERSAELRGHAGGTLHSEFRLFTHRIVLARVGLVEGRKAKAGGDQDAYRCTVQITADRIRPVRVEATAHDPFTAIDRAVRKSGEEFRKLAHPGRRAPAKKADGSGVSKEGTAAA